MDNSVFGQLRVFQAIARQGSISAGARMLGITAPSASQTLKQLEARIGVPLFQRTTRQIQLTEAGTKLLRGMGSALETLEQAVEITRTCGNSPAGLVRVTMSRFAYSLIFRPLFARFCKAYPQIQLELSIFDGTINIVEQGFDLGIRFGNTLEEGMVASQLLPPLREGLYVSQGYIEAHGHPQVPEDLPRHQLIGYRFITSNRILPLILNDKGEDLTIEMPFQLMSNDIDVMADAVRDGMGIGRIFEPVMAQRHDREQYIPVLESWWKTYPGVYLYYMQRSQKASRLQVLIDFLREQLNA